MKCGIKIIDLSKNHPRKNLPSNTSKKRKEALLASRFLSSFKEELSNQEKNYVLSRELELNGYGIADIILLEFDIKTKTNTTKIHRPIITGFEIKIKDWRKALKQGFRYKYYANKAVVVLPNENINSAINRIEIFKMLDVGLWSVEKKNNKINKYFTPRIKKPLNLEAKKKAISILTKKIKFLRFQ